jgi:hypothetical protein
MGCCVGPSGGIECNGCGSIPALRSVKGFDIALGISIGRLLCFVMPILAFLVPFVVIMVTTL